MSDQDLAIITGHNEAARLTNNRLHVLIGAGAVLIALTAVGFTIAKLSKRGNLPAGSVPLQEPAPVAGASVEVRNAELAHPPMAPASVPPARPTVTVPAATALASAPATASSPTTSAALSPAGVAAAPSAGKVPEPEQAPTVSPTVESVREPLVASMVVSRADGADINKAGPRVEAAATGSKAAEFLEEAKRTDVAAHGQLAGLEQARKLYQQALDEGGLSPAAEKECLVRLTELTNRLILDPKVACTAPKAVFHTVEPGEVVERIARQHKVNIGQIKVVNRLNENYAIRFGQKLKILPGEVVFRVDRARLTGTLYLDGVFLRRYPVGVGPAEATPLGTYAIENKVVNPDWYYEGRRVPFGDPENILGTRWLGLSPKENGGFAAGLGIHGTSRPQSVPGRESKGCIRMLNSDVDELYDLMPQGGKVEIIERGS